MPPKRRSPRSYVENVLGVEWVREHIDSQVRAHGDAEEQEEEREVAIERLFVALRFVDLDAKVDLPAVRARLRQVGRPTLDAMAADQLRGQEPIEPPRDSWPKSWLAEFTAAAERVIGPSKAKRSKRSVRGAA